MQRPDAYTAAGKLTKPVWLLIIGGAGAFGLLTSLAGVSVFAIAIAAVATGIYLVDVRPKILEIQGKSRSSASAFRRGRVATAGVLVPLAFAPAAAADPGSRAAVCRPRRVGEMGRPVESAGVSDGCGAGGVRSSRPSTPRRPPGQRCWRSRRTPTCPECRTQFICHWELAELGQPGKTSWNLEPWRPEVDDGHAGGDALQPGRHRGTVLVRRHSYRREDVAALVDHTLLKPEATEGDVARLVDEAAELGVYAICVSPSMVAVAKRSGAQDKPIAAVVGFPSGKHLSAIKAEEARLAVAAGAAEIDMVIDVGAAVSGDFAAVAADVAAVRAAIGQKSS